MSAEEFWHGNPRLAVAYREADILRRDRAYQAEWRAGIYMFHAIGACLSEKSPYPEQPLFSSEEARRQYEEARAKAQMEKAKAMFEAMARRANEKLSEGGVEDAGSDD